MTQRCTRPPPRSHQASNPRRADGSACCRHHKQRSMSVQCTLDGAWHQNKRRSQGGTNCWCCSSMTAPRVLSPVVPALPGTGKTNPSNTFHNLWGPSFWPPMCMQCCAVLQTIGALDAATNCIEAPAAVAPKPTRRRMCVLLVRSR
jgi:hypothetical protein